MNADDFIKNGKGDPESQETSKEILYVPYIVNEI